VSNHCTPSVGTASGPDALQNLPPPANTYAKAWRVVSYATWSHRHIQVHWVCGDAIDRADRTPKLSTDDANTGAIVVGDFRDVEGLDFLIARVGHLLRRWKIGPQLEAMHASGLVALGHFLMDDSAARCHPLDVSGRDCAAVAEAVVVLHGSGEDIRDGLDSAVRVPGEAGQVIIWNIVAEIVEKQERVEIGCVAEAECAAEVHACAFEGWLGFDEPFYRANGHGCTSCIIDNVSIVALSPHDAYPCRTDKPHNSPSAPEVGGASFPSLASAVTLTQNDDFT
jgi:hypothetical protein